MPKVIYEMGGVSADGYIVGPDGKSDRSMPDKELGGCRARCRGGPLDLTTSTGGSSIRSRSAAASRFLSTTTAAVGTR
jgi:hypothetical protein